MLLDDMEARDLGMVAPSAGSAKRPARTQTEGRSPPRQASPHGQTVSLPAVLYVSPPQSPVVGEGSVRGGGSHGQGPRFKGGPTTAAQQLQVRFVVLCREMMVDTKHVGVTCTLQASLQALQQDNDSLHDSLVAVQGVMLPGRSG